MEFRQGVNNWLGRPSLHLFCYCHHYSCAFIQILNDRSDLQTSYIQKTTLAIDLLRDFPFLHGLPPPTPAIGGFSTSSLSSSSSVWSFWTSPPSHPIYVTIFPASSWHPSVPSSICINQRGFMSLSDDKDIIQFFIKKLGIQFLEWDLLTTLWAVKLLSISPWGSIWTQRHISHISHMLKVHCAP